MDFSDDVSDPDEGLDYLPQFFMYFPANKNELLPKHKYLLTDEHNAERVHSIKCRKLWLLKYFEAFKENSTVN